MYKIDKLVFTNNISPYFYLLIFNVFKNAPKISITFQVSLVIYRKDSNSKVRLL